MNWIAWIAIIGAAAWIPHLINLIYSWCIKPSLYFSPAFSIEVGYSLFGPILNPSFAISSSRKDALLEKIELLVVHQSGERHNFIWQILDEKYFETKTITGERIELRKSQPAIALKITIPGLIEKTIGFHDISFMEKSKEINIKLFEEEEHLSKTEPTNFPESLFKTKTFEAASDLIKNGFYWKEGKYEVRLFAYEKSLKKPHVEKFGFSLRKTDVDTLEKNIERTKQFLIETYLYKSGKIEKFSESPWNWVYPAFERLSN
jgi:hypothetical protein